MCRGRDEQASGIPCRARRVPVDSSRVHPEVAGVIPATSRGAPQPGGRAGRSPSSRVLRVSEAARAPPLSSTFVLKTGGGGGNRTRTGGFAFVLVTAQECSMSCPNDRPWLTNRTPFCPIFCVRRVSRVSCACPVEGLHLRASGAESPPARSPMPHPSGVSKLSAQHGPPATYACRWLAIVPRGRGRPAHHPSRQSHVGGVI